MDIGASRMSYPKPTDAQVAFFDEHGYLVVQDAIAEHDLVEIETFCDGILADKENLANDWACDERESS